MGWSLAVGGLALVAPGSFVLLGARMASRELASGSRVSCSGAREGDAVNGAKAA
jgi:hypothetical protein